MFFFLSESSSKIQAQPVDGPSMWVSSCSFVVFPRLFSFFLSTILTRFLPSLLLFRRVVCVGKSHTERETETETESECLCVCVCVCESSLETRSVFFLLLLLLLLGLFCFPKIQSLWQCCPARVCGSSGGVSVVSTSADHLQRASERASKRSKHEE